MILVTFFHNNIEELEVMVNTFLIEHKDIEIQGTNFFIENDFKYLLVWYEDKK